MTQTVLIFGSRDWKDERVIRAWIARLPAGTRIVHGAARGADTMAGDIAIELGLDVKSYPVDEALDGQWPAAGVRRNQRMLDAEPQIKRAIGFSSIRKRGDREITSGSHDMWSRCIWRGIATTIVPPGEMP